MIDLTELSLTEKDYDKAFSEVSFILDVLTKTIGQVVGQATTSVAVSSGKHMAKKLPVNLPVPPPMDQVMDVLVERLSAGFDIEYTTDDTKIQMKVGRCAIRDVCDNRGLEVGGELCVMLHNFWAGMIAELRSRPIRCNDFSAGKACSIGMG